MIGRLEEYPHRILAPPQSFTHDALANLRLPKYRQNHPKCGSVSASSDHVSPVTIFALVHKRYATDFLQPGATPAYLRPIHASFKVVVQSPFELVVSCTSPSDTPARNLVNALNACTTSTHRSGIETTSTGLAYGQQ